MSEVVITLKGDGQAPWIVVHGETPEEAGEMVERLREQEALSVIQQANAEFAAERAVPTPAQAVANVQAAMPGAQVIGTEPTAWPQGSIGAQYGGTQQLPQQFQPGGQAQMCAHGPMNYVPNGQYGPFWACPLPKGTPGKCKSRNAR